MTDLDLLGADWPAETVASQQDALVLVGAKKQALEAAPQEPGWTFFRVLKYVLGGAVLLVGGGWLLKNRGRIALESRTVRRLGASLAGRAKGALSSAKTERQAIRLDEQHKQLAALRQRQIRALEGRLFAARQRAAAAQAPVDRFQAQLARLREG